MFARGAQFVGGYLLGQGLQSMVGTSGSQGSSNGNQPVAPPTTPIETYRAEQQSNEYMPPQQSFMSFPWWAGGAVGSNVMPQPVLDQSVNTFSNPSNPQSTQNRNLATTALTGLTGLIPGPVGPALRVLSSATLGAEHQSHAQSQATPRQPPNPSVHTNPTQIQQDYQQLSTQYANGGFTPQSRVVAHMQPTPTNAQVSHSIHSRLLPGQQSPFTTEQ
jgi:hypothetical protein